ncbi:MULTISPECIES: CaiB/BaiF CoA transferase family protein [Fictibacillus]|uniref:CaiB/BaiF CoA-transferase family protein n=1 Tax=Fictibacillus terranigra TaxID=3058424 RepID=A0ABT8EC33_9BACL|nr:MULTISPECIES: CaiB/BaiF CoA-transferase family protein [unclassified Fictibacillus]MDN4075482.1 CaiB/BaiF CoA-transferase family protein [Fictibacillus sp. CENA-BCM004]MED2974161.1 CaiB/BaiF CoA-transferase family protein [Fictibacillus sp. B-59209]
MAGPLKGLKVLDIATVYAAPFAAALLGDYGADVIKVEIPGKGDPVRGFQPMKLDVSIPWATVSRNKKTITLDLRKEKGQEVFLRLLADQDVLFENFRPGTLEKWGIPIERIRDVNPNIIVVRISGYGQTGPHREKAGFGTSATAFGGYTYINGDRDRPPLSPPISLVDYLTGLFATIGAVVALYHRDAGGGEGQEIDLSLYESMFRLLEIMVATYDQLGTVMERQGNDNSASVPVGTFQTADGKWMVLTTSTDRTFYRLAELMGREEMITDPRYSTNKEREKRRVELMTMVADWVRKYTASDIQILCDNHGVPISPIYSIEDIFQDPQYKARHSIVEVEHASFGKIKLPGVVPKFSKTPGSVRNSGSKLGEHNDEVYSKLGFTPEEIQILEKEGVI